MKKFLISLIAISLLFFVFRNSNLAGNLPPITGGILPPIRLPIPEDPDEKEYLGLSGSGFFSIPQIKAKVVIIEIFSMYCPKCQQIAPGIDKLYYLIESDPNLRNKIKLIGIGAGNSRYEVDVFRKTFNTPFPLFPDDDFTIHEALGNVRSPYFIAIKINKGGTHQVVHSELDSFNEAHAFLESIVTASGLKEE
jgi:thiol-disulfide isomerase/thioredoxin